MSAILFGVPWLDALDIDAKTQPPDRELTQAEQGIAGSEGHTIIRPDRVRQPEVLECSLENGKGKV